MVNSNMDQQEVKIEVEFDVSELDLEELGLDEVSFEKDLGFEDVEHYETENSGERRLKSRQKRKLFDDLGYEEKV